jgi:hypothetical protein
MSSHEVTPRDRVWAAIVEQAGRFQVADVREAIDQSDRPSDETIRRVLRSATTLGTVTHQSGSLYYCLSDEPIAGFPNLSTEGITGQNFLDPKGIDTEEFIDQFPDERGDVIYNENLMDLLNDERLMSMSAQSPPHHYPFRPAPSERQIERKQRVWIAAFRQEFGEADHLIIIDTSTGELVDLSDHLDLDLFEDGTTILDLGELQETPLIDDILTELYRAHRATLEYQEISDNDYREIEEHVRTRVQTFDPDAPAWAEQVERLVEEIVEVFDPNDPREQSRLSEWVRAMAKEEAKR